MIRRILLIIYIIFCPYIIVAQYYVLGDDPSGIHWKQINTDKFQVIYPSECEKEGMRMANLLRKVYSFAGNSLKFSPSKISVLLHTSSVRSNGFVAWAPSRVELFTTPHQEIYAQDWLEQLAIHEFRHVVQIGKIDSELPDVLKILFGEQVAALVTGLYLPFWFLEGDAVTTETALSHTGRGRVPNFEMELKAQSLDKGIYSYDKAYLGSYKDYVPDYYQLGYQLVAGTRARYGSDTWAKVLNRVARKPFSLNPFSRGLREVTGMNQIQLYDTIFSGLKKGWTNNDKGLKLTPFEYLTKKQKGYVSYRYPYPKTDSTFFAVKYSMDDLTRFVELGQKGEEKVLFTPGSFFEESITYGQDKIFWIESKPDIRWAHREFSLLRILNINNRLLIQRKYMEKIYAPCLNSDGTHLVAVKINNEDRSSIVIISPETGEIEKETSLREKLFILTPSWSENGKELFAIVLGNKGKSLAKIDPFTGQTDLLLPFSYNELSRPVQSGNFVFYTAAFSGNDELYAFDLKNKINYRLTQSRFGVRDARPMPDKRNLIYSSFSSDGFRIVKMPLRQSDFVNANSLLSYSNLLADKISEQEQSIVDFSVNDSLKYKSRPYSRFNHLFNFHSWSPVHIDAANEEIRPGFSLMSQNLLGTAITQLGYDYSTINKTGKWVAEFDYTGWFPVLKLNANYGQEKSDYFMVTTHNNPLTNTIRKDTQQVFFSYKILNINGIINLPLNLSQGKWNRLVQPEFQAGYRQTWQESSTPFANQNSTWLTYRLYVHNLLESGLRDQQPAIGQVIDLNYHYSPFSYSRSSPIWTVEGKLYFPGIFRHHGIRIYSGFQHKPLTANTLTDYINYPRGYSNITNNQLFTLRTDYVLPIAYPDLSLGRATYIKRISIRIFYDQAWAIVPIVHQNLHYDFNFESFGNEIYADINFLRLYVPAKMGFRTSYLTGQKKFNYEFLFSINFGSL